MDIYPIPALKDNYIWAIINSQQQAIIIDPGDARPVQTFLQQHQLTLHAILITHHHWDHTNGISALTQGLNIEVYGPKQDPVSGVTKKIAEHDIVSFPAFQLNFSILEIPGHTLGHIAYYAPGMLFCGDTLFAAGCGRLFEGTAEQMYTTLQKLAALPDDTAVYCAHEYTLHNLHFAQLVEPNNPHIQSRLKHVQSLRAQHKPSLPSIMSEEKLTNPFLRCEIDEVKQRAEKQSGVSLTNPVDVFRVVREWKDGF